MTQQPVPERRLATTDGMRYPDTADRNLETLMGMEPCDVGPMVVLFDDPIEVIGLDNPAHPAFGLKRHRPAGIEPVAERDERAQRRAAERNLMDFYDRLPTYISACDAMKPAIVPHAEAGEIFARLIGRG